MIEDTNVYHPTDAPLEAPASSKEKMLDPISILRAYDQAAVDLFNIITPSDKVQRLYGKDELDIYTIQQLRDLATRLDVLDNTSNRAALQKAILNAQRVPVVFASPAPAFATQEQTTGRKETSPISVNVRYPILSVQRLGVRNAQNRYNRAVRRKLGWNHDKLLVLQAPQPSPVDISYQVECMSTTAKHMNQMDEYMIRLWHRQNVNVEIDHGAPFGVRTIQVFHDDSYSDQTEYEHSSDNAEKLLRHIYTIRFEGWIPNESEWVRTVVRQDLEYAQLSDSVVLESITKDLREDLG